MDTRDGFPVWSTVPGPQAGIGPVPPCRDVFGTVQPPGAGRFALGRSSGAPGRQVRASSPARLNLRSPGLWSGGKCQSVREAAWFVAGLVFLAAAPLSRGGDLSSQAQHLGSGLTYTNYHVAAVPW